VFAQHGRLGQMRDASLKRELGGRVEEGTDGWGCLLWRRRARVRRPPAESPERVIWNGC
jgi:hypothetical protein